MQKFIKIVDEMYPEHKRAFPYALSLLVDFAKNCEDGYSKINMTCEDARILSEILGGMNPSQEKNQKTHPLWIKYVKDIVYKTYTILEERKVFENQADLHKVLFGPFEGRALNSELSIKISDAMAKAAHEICIKQIFPHL